jgi:hypothetical protein
VMIAQTGYRESMLSIAVGTTLIGAGLGLNRELRQLDGLPAETRGNAVNAIDGTVISPARTSDA